MNEQRPLRCQVCGKPLPLPARTGRPRRYCSDRCRYQARGNTASMPATIVGSAPTEQLAGDRRARIAAELAASLDGADPTAPEDRLAGLLVELGSQARHLELLAPELPPALRVRALELASRIERALSDRFQEVARV